MSSTAIDFGNSREETFTIISCPPGFTIKPPNNYFFFILTKIINNIPRDKNRFYNTNNKPYCHLLYIVKVYVMSPWKPCSAKVRWTWGQVEDSYLWFNLV